MTTCLHHNTASGNDDRVLLVMLPGAGIGVGEFAEHGVVVAMQKRDLAVDVVATYAMPHLGHGRRDRFAQGHRMLTGELPGDRVVAIDGDYNGGPWLALGQQLFAAVPFATESGNG